MMVESALYILAGIAFYGGAHQLYLGARQASDHPHVIHGVMYVMLCAFALTSAMTFRADSIATLIPTGKLSVFTGLLLWGAFAWFIAACTGFRPRLPLATLTVVWSLLLIGNIGAPFSLLYSDVTPLSQTLPSGQVQVSLHTSVSPWWTVVQLAMLASLVFAFYASYRLYRAGESRGALALGSGLVVLLGATACDALVTAGLIQSAFLAPFGFLILLVSAGVYPGLQALRKMPAEASPASYNMTFHLNQPPYGRRPTFIETPLAQTASVDIDQAPQAEIAHQESSPPFAFAPLQTRDSDAQPAAAEPQSDGEAMTQRETAQSVQEPRLDEAALTEVSDNLIDIAVYATMAMNRFKRGAADPATLEALFKKVRTQAISTRRIANRIMHPSSDKRADDDAPSSE